MINKISTKDNCQICNNRKRNYLLSSDGKIVAEIAPERMKEYPVSFIDKNQTLTEEYCPGHIDIMLASFRVLRLNQGAFDLQKKQTGSN